MLTMVRYRTTPDRGDENQVLVEAVYDELAASSPEGLRYATFRLDDGVTFVHVADLRTEDGSNPLLDTAAFAAFQQDLPERCEVLPEAVPASVVGSFGLLAD